MDTKQVEFRGFLKDEIGNYQEFIKTLEMPEEFVPAVDAHVTFGADYPDPELAGCGFRIQTVHYRMGASKFVVSVYVGSAHTQTAEVIVG